MAIINCPECNEKISDTVERCIHCGAAITVCPECKKAYVGKKKICDECGYVIQKASQQPDDFNFIFGYTGNANANTNTNTNANTNININTKSDNSVKQVEEQWSSEIPTRKIYTSSIFEIVSPIIVIILMIVGGSCFLKWIKSEGIFRVSDYESTYSTIVFVIISIGVLEIADSIFEKFSFLGYANGFKSWLNIKCTDLNGVIRGELNQDFSKFSSSELVKKCKPLKRAMRMQTFNDDPNSKSNVTVLNAFAVMAECLGAVLFSMFLIQNAKIVMQAELLRDAEWGIPGWDISKAEYWYLLIFAVALFIIGHIIERAKDKKENESIENWVNKNMPEHLEKYQKFIKVKNLNEFYYESLPKN